MMGVATEWAICVARLRNRMLIIVRLIKQRGKTAAIQ